MRPHVQAVRSALSNDVKTTYKYTSIWSGFAPFEIKTHLRQQLYNKPPSPAPWISNGTMSDTLPIICQKI